MPNENIIKTFQTNIDEFYNRLEDIANVVSKEKLFKLCMNSLRNNKSLQKCTPSSIVAALVESASAGIEPDDGTGRAYLVPYRGEARFQMGYKGFIELIYKTGLVSSIMTQCVFTDDEFHVTLGTNVEIIHRPSLVAQRSPENMVAVYAVIKFRDGSSIAEVMSHREVDLVRRLGGPVWREHYLEMARKSAIRKIAKYAPATNAKSAYALQRAIVADEEGEYKPRAIQTQVTIESISANKTSTQSEPTDNDIIDMLEKRQV
jgi:recombination protein RecT